MNGGQYCVGERVRVYPGGRRECSGVIVEDFAETAGYSVSIGDKQIVNASRRWAVALDDGTLVFVDTNDLQASANPAID